jgi:hypothetical protein
MRLLNGRRSSAPATAPRREDLDRIERQQQMVAALRSQALRFLY